MAESNASSLNSVTEIIINITQNQKPEKLLLNHTTLIKMSHTCGQEKKHANVSTV